MEALKLAVATPGNSNKVQLADEYLTFLRLDEAQAKVDGQPQKIGKPK